ncbi:MAG TPA: tetratricopeptide repeat protein [Burkholderiales bacterium]|nr:tetratricopeptide repeat protein [Burkholderiales bacterium]
MTPSSPLRPLGPAASRALLVAAAVGLAAACTTRTGGPEAAGTASEESQPIAAAGRTRAAAEPSPELPNQDLTGDVLYEFLIAEIAGQRGNLALSAQAYADLAKRTRDPRLAERATEMALHARMPEAAIESAKIWAEASPGNSRALATASSLLIRANRLDEAEPYLQKVLAVQSANRGDGFLQLNGLLANNPDKATNLRVIQRLAQSYPDLAQAHFAVAQAASNAGQDDLALKEIREAARLSPDWELAVLYEASLLQKGSNDAAADRLAGYLKTHPKSREVRLAYARTLVADKKFPEARGQFEQLLKDNPGNTDVVFAVAVLSMQLEDWPGAEANLKRLLDLGYADRNSVRFYLGQVTEEQKRFPEALQWYGEVTRSEQFMPAQIRTAQVMSKQGDLAGARKYLQNVSAANNDQRAQLIIAESQLLRDADQPKEAFEVVERGLGQLPDNPDLLYDYAMLAEKLDRMDVLESSLRMVIKLKPEHAHAYNALGYSLADRNVRLDEAKGLIDEALKLAPDDSYIIDSLGWVLYRQGKNEEALKELQRAYAGRPDAEIAAHLGEVLWVTGRRSEAQKIWDEALAKTPSNDVLIKTVQKFKQ